MTALTGRSELLGRTCCLGLQGAVYMGRFFHSIDHYV